jgi:hypothetical protein
VRTVSLNIHSCIILTTESIELGKICFIIDVLEAGSTVKIIPVFLTEYIDLIIDCKRRSFIRNLDGYNFEL